MILVDAASRRFLMCNKSICKMLGYTEKEMCALGISKIHPVKELPHIAETFKDIVDGASNFVEDIPMKKKDSTIFYADISATLISLMGRKHILGSFRDVTERKSIEAALQISENNYRSIFELASDAIMIRDIETYQTVDVNKAACEMFRYSKKEMLGLYIRNFMVAQAPYTWENARHFYEKAAQGEPQLFEWLVVDKNGRSFWVEANVKRNIIGGHYRLMSILRDITERKKLESMKDGFVNSVSHELRTPLAAIKEGVSITLEEIMGKIGKENKKILRVVKNNVDRLSRLINNVLDFQKLESGDAKFRPKPYNMNNVVMECYRAMSVVAREKRLGLLLNLDKKVKRSSFDKDKVLQVLMNLVNNAVKFTKKGRITISTKSEGNIVKVSIADTGIGIKENDLPKLFKKFGQIENRVASKTPGTGLGLAISKSIIERHGGKIWAESEWGKGSIFYFTIPIKKEKGRKRIKRYL